MENQSIPAPRRVSYSGKLTPRLQAEAVRRVQKGTPERVALKALGVCNRTIDNWQQWAETGEKGPKYGVLFAELRRAWAEWQSYVADTLPNAVQKDSRMAVEVASRIMPDEYGKRDSVDVSVQIDAGPVLKAIAEAQQRLALQGITEAEWREDELQRPREAKGGTAEVGSTEAGGSCRTA